MLGLRVMVVAEGTVIEKDGVQYTVTATEIICDGDVIWMTQRHYDRLNETFTIENEKGTAP